jgi:hypothetical protein
MTDDEKKLHDEALRRANEEMRKVFERQEYESILRGKGFTYSSFSSDWIRKRFENGGTSFTFNWDSVNYGPMPKPKVTVTETLIITKSPWHIQVEATRGDHERRTFKVEVTRFDELITETVKQGFVLAHTEQTYQGTIEKRIYGRTKSV